MAAFDFPNSPALNSVHTENGISFKWDGTVWKRVSATGAQGPTGAQGNQGSQGNQGQTGAQAYISDAAPSSGITNGDLWWDSDSGDFSIYYDDGSGSPSAQWVEVGSTGPTGPTGAQGAQGHQGHQGVAGAQGAQGHQGHQGAAGAQGAQGAGGTAGAQGAQGNDGNFGGATFYYTFESNTTNANPGAGDLRLDNSTQNAATGIYICDTDEDGTDIASYLQTIDDSTSTIKGHVKITNKLDSSQFILFTISSLTDNSGYFDITVSPVDSSATNPFSANEDILITFARTGDKGDTGAQGAQGYQGHQGSNGAQGSQGSAGSATISNNADNRVITGGSGTNLNAEQRLTYNGHSLTNNNVTSNQNSAINIYKSTGDNADKAILRIGYGETNSFKVWRPRADANIYMETSQDGSDISIRTNSGGTIAQRVVIDHDGKVIIGNTSGSQPSATVAGAMFYGTQYPGDFRISSGAGASGTTTGAISIMGSNHNASLTHGNNYGAQLSLYNYNTTDGNSTAVSFLNSNGLAIARVLGNNVSHSSRTGALVFMTSNGSHPTEKARIHADGKMSIGSVETTTGGLLIDKNLSAASDVSDKNNYHLVIRSQNNDNSGKIGIAFADTTDDTHVGAAILHHRETTDSVGSLAFYTSPSSGTTSERFRITRYGELGLSGANYGSSGQVLTSQGSGSAAQWATPSSGVNMVDEWRLSTNLTNGGSEAYITSNWVRNSTNGFSGGVGVIGGAIGSAMSVSSGYFSFPSTGIYKVEFNLNYSINDADTKYFEANIIGTKNNSTYTVLARSYGPPIHSDVHNEPMYGHAYTSLIFDVTNTSNCKFRLNYSCQTSSNTIIGGGYNATCVTVTRLGDT